MNERRAYLGSESDLARGDEREGRGDEEEGGCKTGHGEDEGRAVVQGRLTLMHLIHVGSWVRGLHEDCACQGWSHR
jgi:hypothetical protein